MDDKRKHSTAFVASRQDRRTADRRGYAPVAGRFDVREATHLEGPLRCERNDVGEVVAIWVGDNELLDTVLSRNDRRENLHFTITISCV